MFKRIALITSGVALSLANAYAQVSTDSSHVAIYGIIDAGIEHARTSGGPTAGRLTSVASGSNAASRLGFDSREDLGGGLYAGATLELGFDADTGSTTSATKYFNRASYIRLGGGFGEIRLGREYTPAFYVVQRTDTSGLNMYGNAGTFTQMGPNNFIRTDNGINYTAPAIANIVTRASISMGDERSTPPKDTGRVAGVSALYDDKTFLVGGFYQVRRDLLIAAGSQVASTRFMGLAGRWNGPRFSLSGGASRWDPAGPDTATAGVLNSWWIGTSVRLGAGEIRAQAGKLRKGSTSAVKPEATLFGVSYLHYLSRRTALYATFGKLDNNQSANFRLEAASRTVALPVTEGVSTRALTLGMTHRF